MKTTLLDLYPYFSKNREIMWRSRYTGRTTAKETCIRKNINDQHITLWT